MNRRAGLIVNPRSGAASGRGLALAAVLKRETTTPTVILDDFAKLPTHLTAFADAGVTDLFISSGDGTIQAIQTELAETYAADQLPRLCLLPHGTTNMTAADIGFRSSSVAEQARFIAKLRPEKLCERHTLRVVNPADHKPRHGMFLGTGAIAEVTAYCQRVYNARGVKGNWATTATFVRAVGRIIFTRADPTDTTRLDRPYPLTVTQNTKTIAEGLQLMILTTTLEKLVLGAKPFWGEQPGPLRTSIFPYPPPNPLRWLPTLMYGTKNGPLPKGAHCFSSQQFTISSPTSYVIDGEFFEGPAHQPLHIETGPLFTYIKG